LKKKDITLLFFKELIAAGIEAGSFPL